METNSMLMSKCGTRIAMEEGGSCIKPIIDRAGFDKAIIYSKAKSDAIKSIVRWNPMNDEWKATCKERSFWFQDTIDEMKAMHPKMDDRLVDLRKHLLNFAGEATCLPAYEEDIDDILKYGQFWVGNNIKIMKGLPSQCHYNSSRLWEKNKKDCRICTGYALSDDGMWRQHSWVIWMKPRSNQIIETTVPRIVYFGYVMTSEQCELFAHNNY